MIFSLSSRGRGKKAGLYVSSILITSVRSVFSVANECCFLEVP